MEQLDASHARIKKAAQEFFGTQTSPNVDDFVQVSFLSLLSATKLNHPNDFRQQHQLLEHIIKDYEQPFNDYVKDAGGYLTKLKSCLNSLVLVNRIPVEVLARIIRLTGSSEYVEGWSHYVPYTWVCHHWRLAIIETADFWTLIKLYFDSEHTNPFIEQLIDRSRLAKLDVRVSITSTYLTPILEDLLTRVSSRIHTLRLETDNAGIIERIFEGKCLSSLRRVIYIDLGQKFSSGLLPVIAASSNHLETLHCTLSEDISAEIIKQPTLVLCHISYLSLEVTTPAILDLVLDSLHNNIKLRGLRLKLRTLIPPNSRSQVVLPEVRSVSLSRSLRRVIRAPKVLGLDLWFDVPVAAFHTAILEDYNYNLSSIKHLRISSVRDELGLIFGCKGPIDHIPAYLSRDLEDLYFPQNLMNIMDGEDIYSDWSRGCFRLQFRPWTGLKDVLPSIVPRLTGVSELCLGSLKLLSNKEFHLGEFISRFPCLKSLIILYGITWLNFGLYETKTPIVPYRSGLLDLIRLLNNTSLCPQLEHLSYTVPYTRPVRNGLGTLAEQVGLLLTKCLESRHKIHGDTLKYIFFGRCPPLSDSWLREIQKLGTIVMTEEDDIYD